MGGSEREGPKNMFLICPGMHESAFVRVSLSLSSSEEGFAEKIRRGFSGCTRERERAGNIRCLV